MKGVILGSGFFPNFKGKKEKGMRVGKAGEEEKGKERGEEGDGLERNKTRQP